MALRTHTDNLKRISGALTQLSSVIDEGTSTYVPLNLYEFSNELASFERGMGAAWNSGLWYTGNTKGVALTRKFALMAVADIRDALLDNPTTNISRRLRGVLLSNTETKFKYLQDSTTDYAKWKKAFWWSKPMPLVLGGNLAHALTALKRGKGSSVITFNRKKKSPLYNVFDPTANSHRSLVRQSDAVLVYKYAERWEYQSDNVLAIMAYDWVLDKFPKFAEYANKARAWLAKEASDKEKKEAKITSDEKLKSSSVTRKDVMEALEESSDIVGDATKLFNEHLDNESISGLTITDSAKGGSLSDKVEKKNMEALKAQMSEEDRKRMEEIEALLAEEGLDF